MKHSVKISVMALVAMFAFSTAADAQFGLGGLVKAAKKAVKGNKKTEIVLPGSDEPVKVKGEMKVYDENAALGKDMVRTIFMLADQKMMRKLTLLILKTNVMAKIKYAVKENVKTGRHSFYAVPVFNGTLSFNELCEEACDDNTYSTDEN